MTNLTHNGVDGEMVVEKILIKKKRFGGLINQKLAPA